MYPCCKKAMNILGAISESEKVEEGDPSLFGAHETKYKVLCLLLYSSVQERHGYNGVSPGDITMLVGCWNTVHEGSLRKLLY